MEFKTSWLWRRVDGMGPAVFWTIWGAFFGAMLAVYANAIPIESAGVKLVASFIGPAAGAALGVMGALKVMLETGRREARRALNQLLAGVTSCETTFLDLIDSRDLPQPASPREVLLHLVLGREALLDMLDVSDSALQVADTLAGAKLYRRIKSSFRGLEALLDALGKTADVKSRSDAEIEASIERFRNLLQIVGRQRAELELIAAARG